MPKATKLHHKGKPSSIQKHHKVEKDTLDSADPDESMRQFQLELCWCIQQLERSLSDKKGNEKQLQETWKVLTVLKNNSQPVIRKRQLMRTHFGDYRAKMAAEEKKLVKMASKMKITEAKEKPKATFLRKSAFLSTGDSSFRFNFDLAPEQVDNNVPERAGTDVASTESKIFTSIDNNTEGKVDENLKPFKFSQSGSEFKFNFNLDSNS